MSGKSHWRASCSSRNEPHQLTNTQLQLLTQCYSKLTRWFVSKAARSCQGGEELAKNDKPLIFRNMHHPHISIEGMLLNLYHRYWKEYFKTLQTYDSLASVSKW